MSTFSLLVGEPILYLNIRMALFAILIGIITLN
jgi:hypothetical protein